MAVWLTFHGSSEVPGLASTEAPAACCAGTCVACSAGPGSWRETGQMDPAHDPLSWSNSCLCWSTWKREGSIIVPCEEAATAQSGPVTASQVWAVLWEHKHGHDGTCLRALLPNPAGLLQPQLPSSSEESGVSSSHSPFSWDEHQTYQLHLWASEEASAEPWANKKHHVCLTNVWTAGSQSEKKPFKQFPWWGGYWEKEEKFTFKPQKSFLN